MVSVLARSAHLPLFSVTDHKRANSQKAGGCPGHALLFVADLNSANSHKDAATTLPHAGDIPLGGGKYGGHCSPGSYPYMP